jgi:hypothetical protein
MRVRRRIPPLPRLGRQAEMTSRDDLAMNKLRRKRSTRDQALTSNLHLSDDVKQLAAYDLSDFDQRAAPLPRLGLHRLIEDRSIPLPRIGRVVDDLSPYEYGFEFGDYGVQSSLSAENRLPNGNGPRRATSAYRSPFRRRTGRRPIPKTRPIDSSVEDSARRENESTSSSSSCCEMKTFRAVVLICVFREHMIL